jgi:hypothetical protein
MAKRTTPPLAYSEYVSPNSDSSVQVWQARLRVIEAAKRVHPIFLEKLSTDVFPLYCQLAKEGKLAKGRNDFDKAVWGKSPYDALTDDGGLKLALSHPKSPRLPLAITELPPIGESPQPAAAVGLPADASRRRRAVARDVAGDAHDHPRRRRPISAGMGITSKCAAVAGNYQATWSLCFF